MSISQANGQELDVRSDRDQRGRFVVGHPGGPGRPPSGLSITDAIRERASIAVADGDVANVDALADEVWRMARDPKLSPRDRLAAITFITDRLEGKARQAVEIAAPKEVDPAQQVRDVLARAEQMGIKIKIRNPDGTTAPTEKPPGTGVTPLY